ncbi:protein kinase [Micromonospora sp. WMMD1102]|uniref:serine/threonine-protein kinase n=1 Tax=Micromonospora sp. WMMD1102 TaxID=3016105 RepID=UPI0024158827|nr:serine/threonine-protein kinase [Micromonospora sp. WMMD1102]MDG4787793.1 protein kinase [Micromonospora sp. WMMD1102]
MLASGDRVTETLVVDRLLGEGAFAEVHRVRHEYLGWQAMKVFKQVVSLDETRTLLEEARLLSTLGHPNIVRVFDAGTVRTSNGVRGFFTMEYVAGGSLERLIRAHAPAMPVELAVEAAEQIAAGLTVAHEQDPPILHRDLTLANILVGYDGSGLRVRVSDFGLAKRADPFTMLASAQGTFAFMAPEVLRREGYSRASDVWSVGTIGYLLLTGRLPYDDGAPLSSYSPGRFARAPLPPSRYHPEVDPELDRIILSALQVDPADRPASAGVLAAELRDRRLGGAASGRGGPPDARARRLATEALALARQAGQLDRAAELMAEALELAPDLRARYQPRLALWRRGVTM